jgi:hypothetical protein
MYSSAMLGKSPAERAGGLFGEVPRGVGVEFGDAEQGLHMIGPGVDGVEDSVAEFE